VLGPGSGGLAPLVDRESRYTIIVKIRPNHANHVQQKVKERLNQLDTTRRRTVTFDHGTNPLCQGCISSTAAKKRTNNRGQPGRKIVASSLSPAGIRNLLEIR